MTTNTTQENAKNLEKALRSVRSVDSQSLTLDDNTTLRIKERILREYLNSKQPTLMEKLTRALKANPMLLAMAGLVILCLFAIGGTAAWYFTGGSDSTTRETTLGAYISVISGTAEVREDDEWEDAEEQMDLYEGAVVRTGKDSKMIVSLDDGSSIRLDENTEVTLSSLTRDNFLIKQEDGRTYHRVDKTTGLTYSVEAMDVTTTALGTAFEVKQQEEKKLVVTVIESNVEVDYEQNQERNRQTVQVQEQEKAVITAGDEIKVAVSGINRNVLCDDDWYEWNKEEDEKDGHDTGAIKDITRPELTVDSPADGSTTEDDKVTVSGTTEKTATVKVNDAKVENNDGQFSTEVALAIGQNTIKVKAIDTAGNYTIKQLSVTRNQKQEEAPAPEPTPAPAPSAGLKLSGSATESGVYLSWTVSNLSAPHGFKIVKSKDANPVYPGSDYQYLSSPDARNYTWGIKDGQTYHFRVCTYNGSGGCVVYSNDITVTAPGEVNLTGSVPLSWTLVDDTDGCKKPTSLIAGTPSTYGLLMIGRKIFPGTGSGCGLKVVWGQTANPSYPGAEGAQYLNNDVSAYTVTGLKSGYTYHFRVCKYKDGACAEGDYTNDVEVAIP